VGRDLRIDVLRGVAIVFIVVNHIELTSLFELVSQETIGIVSGAEMFVAMSGVVVGMVYRQRLAATDLVEVTGRCCDARGSSTGRRWPWCCSSTC
jgi:hypothetical protein